MGFSLKDKVALVTGGGSGIGESICREFAAAGAHVFVLDIRSEEAARVAAEIQASGNYATPHALNVADQEEVIRTFSEIADHAGRIDILVNSAGVAHIGTVETTTETDFDRIFHVNVKGVYNSMHAAVPQMKKQGKGVILNLASVASTVGIPDRFAYSMSKGAVLTMTYSVARDYVKDGIRCNCIAPARVHTPFVDGFLANNYPGREQEMFDRLSQTQPIGRMGQPLEMAWLARYLCSDEAAFITGSNFPIDGGFTTLNN